MSLNEFSIIEKFFKHLTPTQANVLLGIGDDAAIVSVPSQHELIITTDTLVAGVHFPKNTTAYDIGYKSLAVNLSDLAAMGATPTWITLALTLPDVNEVWLKEFSAGLFTLLNQYQIQLIGGDMTRGPLTITIQAHGIVPNGLALKRTGAQVNDLIYVSNTLGNAGLALQLIDTKIIPVTLIEKLNRPQPQIEIGTQLRNIASSAIDISDGLAADLTHLLTKNQVGACLNVEALPLSNEMKNLVSHAEGINFALTAGDDYELCFTVPAHKKILLDAALKKFSYTCIGTITATPELNLQLNDGKQYAGKINGYQHF